MIAASKFDMESSKYMGIDAVKKLRLHYNINKVGELSISPSFFLFLIFPPSFSSPVSLPHFVLLSVLPSSLFLFLLLSHKPFSPLTLSYHFLLIAGNRQRSRITASDCHSEGITVHTTQHKHLYYKIKQCCCHVDQC